jgi:TP901 family phage tail tape measure protein
VRFGAEISGFTSGVKAVMGGFGMLQKGASEIGFGFKNLGTSGTVGMDAIKSGVMSAGSGLLLIGGLAAAAGVAVGAYIGVRAVQAAADFQQGLTRLVTGAGDVTDNMGKMGQSILGISVGTGVLTGQLLPAMYQIISANQRGAQAEDTLGVAAKGSVAEQAKVVDVAKALTTAMTDYGTTQFNATQFMNGYTRATQLGKVTLEQLSNSMGPILPLAKNVGISFADVSGAMATMTNAGIPATVAATSLRFLMQSLENPTLKARNAMDAMGLSSVAVGNEMKVSLPRALEMIYKAALKAGPEGSVPFNRAMSDMIGGQRSLQAMLSLTGTHFSTFASNSKAVSDAMNASKTAVLGWDVAQSNFNVKMDQARAAVAALMISIGQQLLPVITQIAGQITPVITRFAEWVVSTNAIGNAIKAITPFFATMFSVISAALPTVIGIFMGFLAILRQVFNWVTQNQTAFQALMIIAKVLGAVIVGALAITLLMVAVSFAAVAAAILIVVGVVMALIFIWRQLVALAPIVAGAWNAAIAFLVGLWHSLVNFAISTFNAVKNAIITAFNSTIAWIVGAWNAAIAFIVGIWRTLVGFAVSTWNAIRAAIVSVVQGIVTWLVNAWNTCVQGIVSAFTWLYNHNYYWQALVDFIRNTVQSVVSWLVTAWQNCVSFIASVWSTLTGLASSAWGAATSVIMSVVNAVISWLQGAWAAVIGWLGGAWNTLAGIASAAWNFISSTISSATSSAVSFLQGAWSSAAAFLSGVWETIKGAVVAAWNFIVAQFAAAWGRISGPLSSLGASIGGFFSNLAAQAVGWGSSIVQGLADGITGAIGWVVNAASNVASTISSILGFHQGSLIPPKEGPARDANVWAPALVTGFADMLAAGQGDVSSAAGMLMRPLVGQMTAPLGSPQSPIRSGPSRTTGSSSSDNRPIIIQVGNAQYQAFIRNLGRDMATQIYIQGGGKL